MLLHEIYGIHHYDNRHYISELRHAIESIIIIITIIIIIALTDD